MQLSPFPPNYYYRDEAEEVEARVLGTRESRGGACHRDHLLKNKRPNDDPNDRNVAAPVMGTGGRRSFVRHSYKNRRAISVESRLIISNRRERYPNLLPVLKTREGVGFFVRSHKPDYAGSIPASGTI